jgi:hypothetical protein
MAAVPIGVLASAAGRPIALKSPVTVMCLCGTPLRAQTNHWDCNHCGRAFCRECGGPIARQGGCDMCTVCGSGVCG